MALCSAAPSRLRHVQGCCSLPDKLHSCCTGCAHPRRPPAAVFLPHLQPFKDNANLPDPEQGWSPERSQRLGAALLQAILEVAPRLR